MIYHDLMGDHSLRVCAFSDQLEQHSPGFIIHISLCPSIHLFVRTWWHFMTFGDSWWHLVTYLKDISLGSNISIPLCYSWYSINHDVKYLEICFNNHRDVSRYIMIYHVNPMVNWLLLSWSIMIYNDMHQYIWER